MELLPFDSIELRKLCRGVGFVRAQPILNLAAVVSGLEAVAAAAAAAAGEEEEEEAEEEDEEVLALAMSTPACASPLDSGPPRILSPPPGEAQTQGEEEEEEDQEEEEEDQEELSFAMSSLMAPVDSREGPRVELGSFQLNVIFDKWKTGFETEKDWKVEGDSIIAGRYRVLKKLGEAAFSNVFQCLDLMAASSSNGSNVV